MAKSLVVANEEKAALTAEKDAGEYIMWLLYVRFGIDLISVMHGLYFMVYPIYSHIHIHLLL